MDRLAAMQTYVTVIETGSFSAAGRQMRVGQPAVSKTIAQLEDRLGVTLLSTILAKLERNGRRPPFYERAKHAIAEVDEAEFAAKGVGAGLVGRLRVSAPITFTRLNSSQSSGGS